MENKKLEELVFTALGEASMCWSEIPKGVFESSKAAEVGKKLVEQIKAIQPAPPIEVSMEGLRKEHDRYKELYYDVEVELDNTKEELRQAKQANIEAMKETLKYFFECGRNYQNNAEVTFKVAFDEYKNSL